MKNQQILVALVIMAMGFASNSKAKQVPGFTPGEFSVDASGGANYHIPITIPPGTAGMAPSLSLSYNSNSGNGILGMGWTLGGLSVITRCPATKAQDGYIDGVDFDSKDRFCIDGLRLIAISGAYGANGTAYRTELDGFTKVVSYDTNSSKQGPEYFVAYTKSGQILEYGNTTDSRIEAQGKAHVRLWAVNKISDTVGNYLTVKYSENNDNGSYVPSRIDYTGNGGASLSPYASVRFEYETRPDTRSSYFSGSVIKTNQRLKAIKNYVGDSLIKSYQLTYDSQGVSNNSVLTQVQECGSNGYCFTPTQFNASITAIDFTQTLDPIATTGINGDGQLYTGDWNADGLVDVLWYDASSGKNRWYINNGNLQFTQTLDPIAATAINGGGQLYTGDWNADGVTDVLWYDASSGKNRWYINNGNLQFTQTLDPIAATAINGDGQLYTGDWNADGLVDVLWYDASSGKNRWYINNGNLQFTQTLDPIAATAINGGGQLYTGDWNADGLVDVLWYDASSGKNRWYINDGNLQFTQTLDPIAATAINGDGQLYTGDWNADGLVDVLWYDTSSGKNRWYINDGNLQFTQTLDPIAATAINGGGQLYTGDWNADGFVDVLWYDASSGKNRWYINDGNLQFTQTLDPIAATAINGGGQLYTGDWNADGVTDVLWYDTSSGKNRWYVSSFDETLRVDSIVSGLGVATEITYKPLTNTSIYTKGTSAAYPEVDIQAPIYVVSEVEVEDGIGGRRTSSYHYKGLKSSVERGSLGFSEMSVTDQLLGLTTRTQYSQSYPYIGRVVKSTESYNNGTVSDTSDDIILSELTSSFAHTKTHTGVETKSSHGGVLFPYTNNIVKKNYELNSSLISAITTNQNYDNYGNPTTITVTATGKDYDGNQESYTTETTNTYTNDTSKWYLGRLTRVENTQTTPEGQSGTRISAFEYDATTGLLTKEIIEPDRPELKLITDYQYDAYGNKTSVSVSGAGIQTRTTTSGYDARGQFATTITNALGHSDTRTFDAHTGNLIHLTGPNGLTTTWTYDSFGRKTGEQRADGTVTTITREWCDGYQDYSGNPFCPAHGALAVTTESDGQPTTVTISDALGRVIRTATVSRDGQIIYSDTQYNARGEIARKSRPYFEGDTPKWSTLYYDVLSRVYREISPDGSQNNTGYAGLSITITNSLGQINERTKNVLGNVTQVWDADSNDTFYRYDPFGSLTETEDSEGNIIKNTYDIRGRKIAMDDPDMGHWTYQYNALGELISQTDAKSQTVIMEYDLLGRLTKRTESEGTSTWEYDTATNGIGKLKQSTSAAGDIQTYNYDELGRASQALLQIEGQSYTTRTTYDDYSRVSTITYPESTRYTNGLIVQYSYTTVENDGADGYLKTVANADSSLIYWQATAQDAEGHLTDIKLGNGLHTQYNYDNNTGLIDSIVTSSAGTQGDIQNLTFDFDAIGNLTKRTDRNQTVTGITDWLYESFSYDSLNRMTQSKVNGQTAKSYHYDDLGNITFKTGVGNYVYGNNAGPHAVTSVTQDGTTTHYAYDANGNMTTGHDKSISYTSYNKPKRILSDNNDITFSYGIDRSRIKRTDHSTGKIRYYIGSLFEKEQHNNVTTYTHYIKAAGSTIAIETSKSDHTSYTRYLHKDHLGSITAITDHNGLVVEEQSYDAHGKRRNSDWTDIIGNPTPSSTTDRGFTGHEHIDEVGLVHMNGRVYDPALGRFVSADPHIAAPFNSQSLNRYSYVLNNPLSYTDPSGFIFKSIFKGIKKLLKNSVVKMVAPIAIPFIPGAQLWAVMLKGFAAGYVASGGDLKAGIVGALTAGALHAVNEQYRHLAKLNSAQNGAAYRHLTIGEKLRKAMLRGVVKGAAAVMHTGNVGKFKVTFLQSTTSQGLRIFYNAYVGYDTDIGPGGPALPKNEELGEIVHEGRNNIGFPRLFIDPHSWLGEGGIVSRFANRIPGINAVAGLHDNTQEDVYKYFGNYVGPITNVPTMFVDAALVYGAFVEQYGDVLIPTINKAYRARGVNSVSKCISCSHANQRRLTLESSQFKNGFFNRNQWGQSN